MSHLDVSFRLDGTRVTWLGVDYGPNARVIARSRNDGALAILVPGHKSWSGIGLPATYRPAKFVIFDVFSLSVDKEGRNRYNCREILQFPVRQGEAKR